MKPTELDAQSIQKLTTTAFDTSILQGTISIQPVDRRITQSEFIDTLQLVFSDLLDHTIQGNGTAKLFYLKSKIDALDNGQSLVMAQSNYLTVLKLELDKLNKNNKLLERG